MGIKRRHRMSFGLTVGFWLNFTGVWGNWVCVGWETAVNLRYIEPDSEFRQRLHDSKNASIAAQFRKVDNGQLR